MRKVLTSKFRQESNRLPVSDTPVGHATRERERERERERTFEQFELLADFRQTLFAQTNCQNLFECINSRETYLHCCPYGKQAERGRESEFGSVRLTHTNPQNTNFFTKKVNKIYKTNFNFLPLKLN